MYMVRLEVLFASMEVLLLVSMGGWMLCLMRDSVHIPSFPARSDSSALGWGVALVSSAGLFLLAPLERGSIASWHDLWWGGGILLVYGMMALTHGMLRRSGWGLAHGVVALVIVSLGS